MNYAIILLTIVSLSCAQDQVFDFHVTSAGIIKELKVLNDGCDIWLKTDTREYLINGCFDLNVGDTLCDYWINGRKLYSGKKSDKNLFRILSSQ